MHVRGGSTSTAENVARSVYLGSCVFANTKASVKS
jgi:hypothetical protein